MVDALNLWTFTLAAFLFAVLGAWAAKPQDRNWALIAAFGAVALWALTFAALGASDPATRLAEPIRTFALLSLMIDLHRRGVTAAPVGLGTVYGVVMLVTLGASMLQFDGGDPHLRATTALLQMMAALAGLVLTQNLATTGPTAARLLALGCGFVWAGDLALATVNYLSAAPAPALTMVRGLMLLAAGAMCAAALGRRSGAVRVSRAVTYQSLSLVGIGGYFALVALVTSAIGALAGDHGRTLQTAFVFGSTATLLTLVSSTWLRAWLKVKIAKHLFQHRYDYRAEWMRFSGTLGVAGDDSPFDQRAVKAICNLIDSPAGLLLVPDSDALGIGAGWNWSQTDAPSRAADAAFVEYLTRTGRIIELDGLRVGEGDQVEAQVTPQWLIDHPDAWAVAPLLHRDTLTAAIVIARPPVPRPLDWEDLDLLRVAGRQVASHLAEGRARDALAQAERFDEFNRRFAFIVHDIKNLVSGLTLLARNAERHADNPAFRADMVATLQDSAAKLSGLLTRLSQQPRVRQGPLAPTDVEAVAARVVAARRATHPIVLRTDGPALALADAGALEQMLEHLVQNAIEASSATEPVTIAIETTLDAVRLCVMDRGCGMSPAFVRDQLFRPFASSKPGGFGIGAYEARQLAAGFGARLEVDSREGEGSIFRVILQRAEAPAGAPVLEHAA